MIDRSGNVKSALRSRQRGFIINPFQFGGGGGGGGDPNWASVVLSMPMTADFLDVTGKTVTVSGPVISGGAAVFDGSNDFLSLAASSDFGFGTGDFTIEAYLLRTSGATGNRCIFDLRGSSSTAIAGYACTSTFSGLAYAINGSVLAGYGTSFSTTVLEHWALVRQGTTARGYVNGVQRFTGTDSRSFSASPPLFIGREQSGVQFLGATMNHLRITKGVCRYPNGTTFTPPSTPYPTST